MYKIPQIKNPFSFNFLENTVQSTAIETLRDPTQSLMPGWNGSERIVCKFGCSLSENSNWRNFVTKKLVSFWNWLLRELYNISMNIWTKYTIANIIYSISQTVGTNYIIFYEYYDIEYIIFSCQLYNISMNIWTSESPTGLFSFFSTRISKNTDFSGLKYCNSNQKCAFSTSKIIYKPSSRRFSDFESEQVSHQVLLQ